MTLYIKPILTEYLSFAPDVPTKFSTVPNSVIFSRLNSFNHKYMQYISSIRLQELHVETPTRYRSLDTLTAKSLKDSEVLPTPGALQRARLLSGCDDNGNNSVPHSLTYYVPLIYLLCMVAIEQINFSNGNDLMVLRLC